MSCNTEGKKQLIRQEPQKFVQEYTRQNWFLYSGLIRKTKSIEDHKETNKI